MIEGGAAGPKTVFVTGAAGFIGYALCRRLSSLGHRVVGYDNLSRGRREYLPAGVHLIEGDIRDATRMRAAVQDARPDWLIHLAGMHFIPDCIAHPEDTIDVNVTGTQCVLESCRDVRLKGFVFASSAAVYLPSDHPCVEDQTPLRPVEVYGESKARGEELVRAFHVETGIPSSVLRLFNAIGRNETNPHVVPHIFESLQRSDEISLGNTAPRRDYIDTRDVAEAMLTVARTSDGLRVFNVGSGQAYSVDNVLASLQRILGRTIAVVREASRLRTSERMLLLANIDRIRLATGWQPRLTLDDTLNDLVEAYRLQRRPREKS
jgi:UDP-glucose 4-epimerase